MCLCNDRDLCNHKIFKQMDSKKLPLVSCRCNECGKRETTCLGEYCTYSTSENGKDVYQGCINRSLPLVETTAVGSCMSPPLSPTLQKTKVSKNVNVVFGIINVL